MYVCTRVHPCSTFLTTGTLVACNKTKRKKSVPKTSNLVVSPVLWSKHAALKMKFVSGAALAALLFGRPVAAATTTACTDFRGWMDSYNYQCAHYEDNEYCTSDGQPGAGWESHWGDIADWKVDGGVDATKACCVCGGGNRGAAKKKPVAAAEEPQRRKSPRPSKPTRGNRDPKTMSSKDWKSKIGSVKGLSLIHI